MIALPYSIQTVLCQPSATIVDYHCGNLFFSKYLQSKGFTVTGLCKDPTLYQKTAQKYGITLKTRDQYREIPDGVVSVYTLNNGDPHTALLDMRSLEANWYIFEVVTALAAPLQLKGVCNKANQLTTPFKGYSYTEIILLLDTTGFRILEAQHKGRTLVIKAKRKL